MNIKFANSFFDEEEGVSYVALKYDDRIFDGYAFAHPEEEMVNQFFGGSLAECRARIKIFKYEIAKLRTEYKTLENYIKSCSCHKEWDKNSEIVKIIYHQLNLKKKKINEYNNTLLKLKESEREMANLNRKEEFNKFKERLSKSVKTDN